MVDVALVAGTLQQVLPQIDHGQAMGSPIVRPIARVLRYRSSKVLMVQDHYSWVTAGLGFVFVKATLT